MEIMTVTWQRK